MSRPASQTSAKAGAAAPKPPPKPLPAADVRLFVASLRLLDLDRRADWPHLAPQTFSARTADQKQRIAGTEWALFRLFELWDPVETAQKLRPFFPPLEPLQSLNLRAALFRWLSELKKTGVLGRDAVLRKTMLDECKGDRFFELLAVFAAHVLRKVLAAAPGGRSAASARRLATAPALSADEQRSLLPLALAHKAALAEVLRRKDEKRRQFALFAATLDAKARDISQRTRRCIDTPRASRPPVPQRDADALKRQLADNWIGDQQWLGVMLHGDQLPAGDAFLSSRFDTVWHLVERGRELDDAAPEPGLLQDLQSRVQEQQARLLKWKTFHEELRRHNAPDASVEPKPRAPTKAFSFDRHAQHQLPASKETASHTVPRPALRSTYQDILSDMDAELSRVSQSKPQPALVSLRRRRRSSSSTPRSPLRTRRPSHPKPATQAPPSPAWHTEPKTLVSEPKTLVREQKALFEGLSAATSTSTSTIHPQRRTSAKSTPVDSDATLVGQLSSLRLAALPSPITNSPIRRRFQPAEPTPPALRAASSSPLPSEDSAPSRPTFSEPSPADSPPSDHPLPTLDIPALTPEETLADQIISAIGNATPSPVKKPQPRMSMSLVDRTRMTLSRTPSFDPVPKSPLPLPAAPEPADAVANPGASLKDRTRLSMAALSRGPSLKHTRSQSKRESAVKPIHAPRAHRPLNSLDEGVARTKTPDDVLLGADIDYDRVFRSRPRIATSPIFSPFKYDADDADDGEDVTGIDLADVDSGSDGESGAMETSPTKRLARR